MSGSDHMLPLEAVGYDDLAQATQDQRWATKRAVDEYQEKGVKDEDANAVVKVKADKLAKEWFKVKPEKQSERQRWQEPKLRRRWSGKDHACERDRVAGMEGGSYQSTSP